MKVHLEYSRTVANGELYFCPECGNEVFVDGVFAYCDECGCEFDDCIEAEEGDNEE